MKKIFSRILNKIRGFITIPDHKETIEEWARKNGYNKKIEKLYNPSNVSPDDEDWEYLQDLHNDDDK